LINYDFSFNNIIKKKFKFVDLGQGIGNQKKL